MKVKTTGVLLNDSTGAFRVEFSAAQNAEAVKAFLKSNVGHTVEIMLATKEEDLVAGNAEDLSPCASPRYWKNEEDP